MDHAVLQTDRHRYVVVSHLAEGGMGSIFLGRRISSADGRSEHGRSADVVLKQLLPEHSNDPKLIQMFLREARVSANLDHRNIVRTLDLVNAGDDYYIVMEYVQGGDLRTLMRRARRRQARLSIDSALFITAEVLAALAYAHDRRGADGRPLGLIHRDVSPSNILVGSDGVVKLADFGIAKAPTQGSVMFRVKGKLGYMSPEQSRGEPVDTRTDLFALGVVLYETLVGERLFVGQMAQAASVFSQPVRPPSKKRSEISAAIDEVVMRALSLDPVGRYASAQDFLAALEHAARLDGRRLGERALAADLRQACGDDSAGWRNLDVPTSATLDAGAEGTGVIVTDDAGFDDDRPSTGTRIPMLPSKELTSIVHFADNGEGSDDVDLDDELAPGVAEDPDRDLAATKLANDPFASAPRRPPPPRTPATDYGHEEDSAVHTQLAGPTGAAPGPTRDQAAPASAPPPATPRPRLPDPVPRAQFEAPVPRPSLPPPSATALDDSSPGLPPTAASPPPPRTLPLPPQMSTHRAPEVATSPRAARIDEPMTGEMPGRRGLRPRHERTAHPDVAQAPEPATLSSLERSIAGRPLVRGLVGVAVILALLALGIGLGALLSGPSVDGLSEPAPNAQTGARK